MTELDILQKKIDECNDHCGCDFQCDAEYQKRCPLLLGHTARMEYCRENDIPIQYW